MTELYCETCNYKTLKPSDWLKHINSQKHQRKGEKKPTNCDKCDYVSTTHWNVKIHKLQNHSSAEEKSKHKFYCADCDTICLCSAYFKKHMEGKKHANRILINQSLKDMASK